jgi:hypothetical protein
MKIFLSAASPRASTERSGKVSRPARGADPLRPRLHLPREKSRDAYEALGAAIEEIESEQTSRIPEHLKNKHFPVNPEG